jgi:hypothetical protein
VDDILAAFRDNQGAVTFWFTVLGGVSAVLILTGVFSPLALPGVDLANFIGYVLWSAWLIAFAIVLVRRPRVTSSQPVPSGVGS